MSMELVTRIKGLRGIPGKYKRVLEAWAAFADNDGANTFASKESVAAKAGIDRRTVYRNTDALVATGVLVKATGHPCKNPGYNGAPGTIAATGTGRRPTE